VFFLIRLIGFHYLCGMKWIGKRISIVEDKKKTTIIITPERKIWINALMGAWISMWYVIGLSVILSFFILELTGQQKLILFIFLSFWFYYALRVTRSFLWLMWGQENLKIDEISLTIKNSTGKFGKARSYFLENIRKIRTSTPKERSLQQSWEASPWVGGGERIEFDYLGKVIRIGRKLSEKEAKLLFHFLTNKMESMLKSRRKNE